MSACGIWKRHSLTSRVFTVHTKLAEMALLASKDLTAAKQKLPLVGLKLTEEIITGIKSPMPY